jgi:hypothetical protein
MCQSAVVLEKGQEQLEQEQLQLAARPCCNNFIRFERVANSYHTEGRTGGPGPDCYHGCCKTPETARRVLAVTGTVTVARPPPAQGSGQSVGLPGRQMRPSGRAGRLAQIPSP